MQIFNECKGMLPRLIRLNAHLFSNFRALNVKNYKTVSADILGKQLAF